MNKLLQNRIAESETAFFVSALYAVLVWLLAGAIQHHWWLQLGCMAVATYLIMELNNSNTLIRVRSRMVACSFLFITSASPLLFASLRSSLLYVCIITLFRLLFRTYQDPQSEGRMYFAFIFIGLASMVAVHVLYFVPILWLLCATQLQSLNTRTWTTSFLGLLTPYWLATPWLFLKGSLQPAVAHFSQLATFSPAFDFSILPASQLATLVLIALLTLVSMIHFVQKGYEDRIRIRQLFGIFSTGFVLAVLFLVVQPALYETLLPIIFVCASPLIAHFFTLTGTKTTNVLFIATIVITVVLTLGSLFPTATDTLVQLVSSLWSGSSIF